MRLIPVESSRIAKVGYDAETCDLAVEFPNGAVYTHLGVPPELYAGLMSAKSHGKFYGDRIEKQFSVKPREPVQAATPRRETETLDAAIRRFLGTPA